MAGEMENQQSFGLFASESCAETIVPAIEASRPSYSSDTNRHSSQNLGPEIPFLTRHLSPKEGDHHAFIPPRHRRPRNCQVQEIASQQTLKVDGKTVLLFGLSPSVTKQNLCAAMQEMGFTPQVLQALVFQPHDHSASLEFSHSHLASAAFSVLTQRKSTLWRQDIPNTYTPRATSRNQEPEVIDLTEDCITPNYAHDHEDPYGTLSRAVYDDDTSESESEIGESSSEGRFSPAPSSTSRSPDNESDKAENVRAHLTHAYELPQTAEKSGRSSSTASVQRPKKCEGRAGRLRSIASSSSSVKMAVENPKTHVVSIPKAPYNHARRVLLPQTTELPIITVSMRGDVQSFHRTARHRISGSSIPNNAEYRHTVDAVMIGNTAVVGHGDGPFQVSLVHLVEGLPPTLIDLNHRPHKRTIVSGTKAGTAAVSCLAACPSSEQGVTQFFTGGYDKTVMFWSVTARESMTVEKSLTLTTIPEALALRDGRLLIGTSRKILNIDLGHLSAKPSATPLSNAIHQIHVHKQAPNIAILEVDHLHSQIQIFDDRKRPGFDRLPDCSFGGRFGDGPARSSRGDTNFSLFVKGYEDGTVCVWDYRNAKKPVLTQRHHSIDRTAHTIFSGTDIICYSRQHLTFLDISQDES